MKFETILDMVIRSSEKFGALTVEARILDEYQVLITKKRYRVWRQRDAFRARLLAMYRRKCDEAITLGNMYDSAVMNSEDHVALPRTGVRQLCRAVQDYAKKKRLKECYIGVQLEVEK